jgi:hypothetical protein
VGSYVKTFDSWGSFISNVGFSDLLKPEMFQRTTPGTASTFSSNGITDGQGRGLRLVFSTLWDCLPQGSTVKGITVGIGLTVNWNTSTLLSLGTTWFRINGTADIYDRQLIPGTSELTNISLKLPDTVFTPGVQLAFYFAIFGTESTLKYTMLHYFYLEVTYEEPSGVKAYHGTEKVDVLYHWKQNVTALY